MNKIGSSTVILVVTCGLLKDYLRGVIASVNPKFVPTDSKNEYTRIKKNCYPYLSLALGRCPFQAEVKELWAVGDVQYSNHENVLFFSFKI